MVNEPFRRSVDLLRILYQCLTVYSFTHFTFYPYNEPEKCKEKPKPVKEPHMLYTQTNLSVQSSKQTSTVLSDLLTLALMAGMVLGGVALVVGGFAWVVANIDSLLSFQTFKVFFIVNMTVWAVILGGLAYNINSKKRAAVAVRITND